MGNERSDISGAERERNDDARKYLARIQPCLSPGALLDRHEKASVQAEDRIQANLPQSASLPPAPMRQNVDAPSGTSQLRKEAIDLVLPSSRCPEEDYKLLRSPRESANEDAYIKSFAAKTLTYLGQFDPLAPYTITDPNHEYIERYDINRSLPPKDNPGTLCPACQKLSLDGMMRIGNTKLMWDGYERVVKVTGGTTHKAWESIWESAESCELCDIMSRPGNFPRVHVVDRHLKWLVALSTIGDNREIMIRLESPWERRTGYLSLYTSEESALQDILPGRPLSQDPISKENLGFARDWLQQCRQQHKSCNAMRDAALAAKQRQDHRPIRLIDIGTDSSTKTVRLVDNVGDWKDFVALSYCWGPPPGIIVPEALQTRMGNIQEHYHAISLDSLQERIVDAISTTRFLGLQYIWIDALCIVQDSDTDKATEIMKMHHIYGLAAATIVLARNIGAPFGGPRAFAQRTVPRGVLLYNRSDEFHLGYNEKPWIDEKQFYYIGPSLRTFAGTNGLRRKHFNNWDTRGWTLQERCLSNRIIILGLQRILLICRTSAFGERGIHDWENLSDYFNSSPFGMKTDRAPFFLPLAPTLSHWFEIVEDYSVRNLTNPADKPAAMLGIALHIQTYWRAEYIRDSGVFLLRSPAMAAQILWCAAPKMYRATQWGVEPAQGVRESPFVTPSEAIHKYSSWSWLYHCGPVSWKWIMSDHEFVGRVAEGFHCSLDLNILKKGKQKGKQNKPERLHIRGEMRRVYASREPDCPSFVKRSIWVKKSSDLHDLSPLHRLEQGEVKPLSSKAEYSGFGIAVFDGDDRIEPADTDVYAIRVLTEEYPNHKEDLPTTVDYVLLVRPWFGQEPCFRRIGIGEILQPGFFKGVSISSVSLTAY